MEKKEEARARLVATRRARLAQLIATRYASQADFIAKTGENQGEVSALLRSKSFGERKARGIEYKCNLPAGWLDVIEGDPADAPTHMQRVSEQEARLLTLFRLTDDQGREDILMLAETVMRA